MTGLTALAWWLRPVGVLLLWPAAACGLAAAGYFGMGPGIYRKRGGRVGAWAWLAAWPVLVGQWASWGYYARKSRAWDVLSERVWIGRQLLPGEAREAVAAGVTAVVDLTGEFTAPAAFRGARHLSLPVLDLTAPTMGQLREAVAFIERESAGGIVYVHCKAGYSRTAAVAGAWLLETGRAGTAAEAAALLRRARPGMVIRPEAMAALEEFAGARGAVAATVS
jgi:protein-tyrosine phosphatase